MGGLGCGSGISLLDMSSRSWAVFVFVLSAVACGGRDAAAPESRAVASQRLEGEWLLTSFRPETSFEPMLEGLLRAQLGAMVVRVENSTVHAMGIGVTVMRKYEITEAEGDAFKGALYDERGVPYALTGQFQGNALAFTSLDEPWRGQGEMQRRK
jgi:hypothetical protein